MHIHDATESAYRNGYNAGVEETVDKVFEIIEQDIAKNALNWSYQSIFDLSERLILLKQNCKNTIKLR